MKSPFPGMDPYLELQPLISQAYLNGRYDDIDYRGEPDPPLPEMEAAWTNELMRSQGLR